MIKQLAVIQSFFAKLNPKEKKIFLVAAFFVTIVLFDRLLIGPVYSRLNSLDDNIRSLESKISTGLRIVGSKERIAAENKKYASFFGSSGPEEQSFSIFLKEIETLAAKSQLYIIDMKPAGIKEEQAGGKKFLVNLACEGQMDQLMSFMYNVESSSMLLSIERFQVSPKSRESSVAQCTMTIALISIP